MSNYSALNSTVMPSMNSTNVPNGAYILISVSAAVGCTGVVTNGLALVIIFGFTVMWQKINFYLLVNQIAVDFMTCIFIAAQYLSTLGGDPTSTTFNLATTNDPLCRWWYSKALMWMLLNSSNCNVVFLTFERYFKILHPIVYETQFTKVYKSSTCLHGYK